MCECELVSVVLAMSTRLEGSGKSTLLNALTGRVATTSGHVTFSGQPVSRRLRRKMSYVLQEDVFYPMLTLRETLTVCNQARPIFLCSIKRFTVACYDARV